jgi:predicted metal-binding membrane protein
MGSMTASDMSGGMGAPNLPIFGISMMFQSLSLIATSLFVGIWVVGMVAMMFPALIPIVSMYYRVMAGRGLGTARARAGAVVAFLFGYLALYALLGVAAFLVIFVAFQFGSFIPSLSAYGYLIAGTILVATGIWQITPLKDRCLRNCVSPMGFLMTHDGNGYSGALKMGAEHGYYCVGCCYMYMFVMLAVAAMSIPSMVILTVVVTLEKVVVKGAVWFTRLMALGFVAAGVILLLLPGI